MQVCPEDLGSWNNWDYQVGDVVDTFVATKTVLAFTSVAI